MADSFSESTCEKCGCTTEENVRYSVLVRQGLCDACFLTHRNTSAHHGHTDERLWMCPQHPTEEVQSYCQTCENGICATCLQGPHHDGHWMITEKEIQRDLRKAMEKTDSKVKQLRHLQEERTEAVEHVHATFKKAITFIETTAGDIKATITKNLEDETHRVYEETEAVIAKIIENRKDKIKKLTLEAWKEVERIDALKKDEIRKLRLDEEEKKVSIEQTKREVTILNEREKICRDAKDDAKALLKAPTQILMENGRRHQQEMEESLSEKCVDVKRDACADLREDLPQFPERRDEEFFKGRHAPSLLYLLPFVVIIMLPISVEQAIEMKENYYLLSAMIQEANTISTVRSNVCTRTYFAFRVFYQCLVAPCLVSSVFAIMAIVILAVHFNNCPMTVRHQRSLRRLRLLTRRAMTRDLCYFIFMIIVVFFSNILIMRYFPLYFDTDVPLTYIFQNASTFFYFYKSVSFRDIFSVI